MVKIKWQQFSWEIQWLCARCVLFLILLLSFISLLLVFIDTICGENDVDIWSGFRNDYLKVGCVQLWWTYNHSVLFHTSHRVDFYESCVEQLKKEIPRYLAKQHGKIQSFPCNMSLTFICWFNDRIGQISQINCEGHACSCQHRAESKVTEHILHVCPKARNIWKGTIDICAMRKAVSRTNRRS